MVWQNINKVVLYGEKHSHYQKELRDQNDYKKKIPRTLFSP
jgi:hypothetical protein